MHPEKDMNCPTTITRLRDMKHTRVEKRKLTKYRAQKNATVMRIKGPNPKKNVPPIVSKSLARGIRP